MDTIATRVIDVCDRRADGNMSAFARAIGVTPAYISKLKNEPDRMPSDRTIADICRVFSVREEWLRNGTGNMEEPVSREEEISNLVGQALDGSNEFKLAVIRMICSRSDSELQALETALRNIYEQL
nr:MAG TPA: helix-turn-helix domain protein [Caudoviricetes sp.]